MTSWRAILISGALSVVLAGCGGTGSPFESVPVTGKVVYEDGSAILVGGMKLYFYCQVPPIDGKFPRTAAASAGPDGTFDEVTTYKYADGLVLGKHKVVVNCREGGQYTKKIPIECTAEKTTPIIVEVTESGQELEIKVPKP